MSSSKPPSGGASESGSSRRHSMETICQPLAVHCWITSGLNGPETTSRTRSKYAKAHLQEVLHGYPPAIYPPNLLPVKNSFKLFTGLLMPGTNARLPHLLRVQFRKYLSNSGHAWNDLA